MIKSGPMSLPALPANTEAAIFGRTIQLDERALTPDAARYLLSMRLPASGNSARFVITQNRIRSR